MTRFIANLLVLLLLTACSDTSQPGGPPLIVYAPENDAVKLLPLFAEFTSDTGIPIAPIWGDSSVNTDAVIAKQGSPADALITSNVADIIHAADEGALRPIHSGSLTAVKDELKDPDDLWVSLQSHLTTILISPKTDESENGDYEALANDGYRGKLCLTSIANSVNQSLIAWLIEDLGRKPAERVVRGWMRNLATPPFASEAELVAALNSGACQFGILSAPADSIGLTRMGRLPFYFDVSAMGVGRHARNPGPAQQLIEWLIVNHPLENYPEMDGKRVAIAGWRNEEARLLAERAGYN